MRRKVTFFFSPLEIRTDSVPVPFNIRWMRNCWQGPLAGFKPEIHKGCKGE